MIKQLIQKGNLIQNFLILIQKGHVRKRFPALWGVNEPTNDSTGPGSSDQTEAPRNSNNHISQTRQGV